MAKRVFLITLMMWVFVSHATGQNRDESQAKVGCAMGHIAIAVRDLNKSIEWYHNVMGFVLAKEPIEIDTDTSPLGEIAHGLFGKGLKKLRIAQMVGANHVGIELFQFVLPESKNNDRQEFSKTGLLHMCVVASDVELVARKIKGNGGKVRVENHAETTDKKVVFCEDLDGNVIEVSGQNWADKDAALVREKKSK
ncbi:MAG: VOC family protein [Candidatus Ozemobacteraceae bacterium]